MMFIVYLLLYIIQHLLSEWFNFPFLKRISKEKIVGETLQTYSQFLPFF